MLAITLALAACSFVPAAALEGVAFSSVRGRGGASSAGNGASAVFLGRRQDGWGALGTSALTTRHGQHQRSYYKRSAGLPAGTRVYINGPDETYPDLLSLTGTVVEDKNYRRVKFDPILVKDRDLHVIKGAKVMVVAGKHCGLTGKLIVDPNFEHKEDFAWVRFFPCDVDIDGLKVPADPFQHLLNGMRSSEKEGPGLPDDKAPEEIGMAFMYDKDGPMWDSHAGRSAFQSGTPVELTMEGPFKGLTGKVEDCGRVWVKLEGGTMSVARSDNEVRLKGEKVNIRGKNELKLKGRIMHVDTTGSVGSVQFDGGDLFVHVDAHEVVAIGAL